MSDATVASLSARRRVPPTVNEPIRSYAPGTPERASLKTRLASMATEHVDVPVIVNGKEYRTGDTAPIVMPHDHQHVLGTWHKATPELVQEAIATTAAARVEWSRWPWEDRVAVFLRAAELLSTTWRDTLNAATMLGQSKTAFQSEIDAACELIDFFRFGALFAQDLYGEQPVSEKGVWNQTDYRPLEGFIYAVSPFNFTAIGGNLSGAPAMAGNTVIWKPAQTAMLSGYYVMKLLEAAGLPPGVINFVPGDPIPISDALLSHRDLGGVHFTGSTTVFNSMWKTIGSNMGRYRSYPRIVGETGGKDFIMAHPSADVDSLAVAIVRGSFEYQGQKCSACSRVYIPQSLWAGVRDRMVAMMADIRMGDPRDFRNFMGAVIDERSFTKIGGYLDEARAAGTIVAGGEASKEKGYFVSPTLVKVDDPSHRILCEEIFGPVVAAYVYPDDQYVETMQIVDQTSPYALTGAIFANDRQAIRLAHTHLRNAAGNFYINDKCTGAVVGQQPFGGARGSGTNDKAGSKLNFLRWVSPRSIKETFVPPTSYPYPFMGEE
ncbi:L-glutamate gamma-semialdehyde dehydrogenase [Luteitalea sp.]|jgi:1-pyrroline-5-carboxylate dehydrogenase|uniref:L-glutamate gamma-semialdehyde dehydrogenase n=1 Tax=Luteitalea sp. TaxID=2004800 RepID=UPI0037CBAB57